MTKQYMTAFPDFDNGDTFDTLLAALEPMGFVDNSWHYDDQPCIMYQEYEYGNITVWVDYLIVLCVNVLRLLQISLLLCSIFVDDSYDNDGFQRYQQRLYICS
jgi:hypothetical protein